MFGSDWDGTAREFAQHMAQYRILVKRGAVPFRFLDETSQPTRLVEDGPLVIGVFGNADFDGYSGPSPGNLEVDQIRSRLKDEPLEVLGFGLSDDNFTWALLIEAEKGPYETATGKEFEKELLKSHLEDLVWDAWRSANAPTAKTSGSKH